MPSRPFRLATVAGTAAVLGLTAGLAAWRWGSLALPAQLTILTLAPLVLLSGVETALRRPRLRPLAPVLALGACGAAWAALVLAPRALDLPISSLLLWPGIGFGLALGTRRGFGPVLATSFSALAIAVASVFFVAGGTPWTLVFERLEPLAGSAAILAAVAGLLAPAGAGIDVVARRTGLVLVAGALVALAAVRGASLLPLAPGTAQGLYTGVAILVAAAMVWRRRRARPELDGPVAGDGDASRLIVAALVLLLSVGGLLGAAGWHRRGAPQRIVLTERELARTAAGRWSAGGLRLALRWEARDDAQDAKVWLPDGRLNALGFRTDLMASGPEAAQFYGRGLPRNAWVAFELGGPAWQAIEQRRAVARGTSPEASPLPSRLVPIDAGPDPAVLRRRYAGRDVVVLAAIIEMRHASDPMRGASVWGRVARLLHPDVSVPAHLRDRLGPRAYEVVLGVGRLGAVWVEDIRTDAH